MRAKRFVSGLLSLGLLIAAAPHVWSQQPKPTAVKIPVKFRYSVDARDEIQTFFGPKIYIRDTSKPKVETVEISTAGFRPPSSSTCGMAVIQGIPKFQPPK